MGSCCWRMMMVTQSTITLILGIIVHNTVAESLRESFLNTLLNDFSNTFEPEYQGDSVDYNAMMNQYDDDAVDMDKAMFKSEPVENPKPTGKNSGKHVKVEFCQPTVTLPTRVLKATLQRMDALRWMTLRTRLSSAENIRHHRTACVTPSTCSLVQK